jgi:hypothetical protein
VAIVYFGHVMNTSDSLKRQLEKLRAEAHAVCLDHRDNDKHDAWFGVYYAHPSFNQIPGFAKKVEKLAKVDAALGAALQPVVAKMVTLAEEIKQAIAAEAQAKADRKAAQQARKDDAAARKANPYSHLNAQVADLLKEIAVPYRKQAYDMSVNQQTMQIERIREAAAKCGSFDPSMMFSTEGVASQWARQSAFQSQTESMRFLDTTGERRYDKVWSIKPQAELDKIVAAEATRYADDVVDMFVCRVGKKLSDIVDKKGNLTKAEITGRNLLDSWMTLAFADGSGFQVQTQIVWKRSVNNVHFNQFPTCFRNVTMKDGSRMELPSEEKMKEHFV